MTILKYINLFTRWCNEKKNQPFSLMETVSVQNVKGKE